MIPKECKRLAEVDFPIAVVSKHSAREKSIRHGHPSTLHLWWARRPLAACRAMLMALLLPDPCDPHCPEEFKQRAKELLLHMPGWNTSCMKEQVNSDPGLRKALLAFIGDFADWDNSSDKDYLAAARALVKAAHPDETPLVVDPFAGGGSIPLEALRIGCEAFASDLNPVACLILKVMLEDIPREAHRRATEGTESLADELRRVGKEIKEKAEKELAEFYPKDADGAVPIAYLWARTVRCESPNCGAEIPLMRSFWLCKKANRKRALKMIIHHRGAEITEKSKNKEPQCPLCLRGEVSFEIFEPKSEKEVPGGTVTRAKATCPCCNTVLPPERVRAQLAAQRGGADVVFDTDGKRIGGARMLAVVTLSPGIQGRSYRLPTERDYEAVWKAQKRLKAILNEWEQGGKKGLCPVPDEPLPLMSGTFNVPLYGMNMWSKMFSSRQLLTLVNLCQSLKKRSICDMTYPMAAVISRCADYWSSGVVWAQEGEFVAHTFGRQALPMIFDYAEAVPWADASGNYDGAIEWVAGVIERQSVIITGGQVHQGDARSRMLPDASASVWFTDPPYYFAVPYADLSDFFFVWLKRSLTSDTLLRDPTDLKNPLTPKKQELCEMAHWDPVRYAEKDKEYFEDGMYEVFISARHTLKEDGIGSVVFAHKTTEGWEALLSGMIRGGWTITGSWPIATERPGRLRSQDSAALATSVHLVCRPRPEDAPVGDWGEVLRELPKGVGDWMERLQKEGVRGADLVFACIGPALEIFSRYSRVETADGSEVKLAEYLEKVWEVVGRTALEQILGTAEARARNGMTGVLEEDARLTALFLWTLQSTNGERLHHRDTESTEEDEMDETEDQDSVSSASPAGKKGYSLVFDVVRRFAQPLGIDLPKWEGRVIETQKGVVRLMAVSERAKQLFGDDGTEAVADLIAHDPLEKSQRLLFPEMDADESPELRKRGRSRRKVTLDSAAVEGDALREATTLDRVHAAMLLQAGGQANALRMLIKSEQDRGSDFLRLANALSALYPTGSEEKRLLDAMLLAVPR